MNQQVFSVVFSVLLASTLVLETRARGAPNSIFGPVRAKRDIIDSVIDKDCRVVCNDNIPLVVDKPFPSILVNGPLYAIAKLELDIGIIIDPLRNIFGIFIASTGESVVFNLVENEGKYIKPGQLEEMGSFKRFLRNMPPDGMTNLCALSDAISFQLDTPIANVNDVVNQLLPFIIDGISDQLRVDPSIGVPTIVELIRTLIYSVAGNLTGVNKFIGAQPVDLPCDLVALVMIAQGLGTIISKTTVNLDVLYRKGADLQLSNIIQGKGGIETFIQILLLIGDKVDVGPLLAQELNDPIALFTMFAQLDGPNSIFQVYANIISFIKGKSQLEPLIYVLIKFISAISTQQTPACYDIIETLRASMSRLQHTMEKIGCTRYFANASFLLKKLLDGNLFIDGVNISEIVNIMSKLRHGEAVEIVVAFEVIVRVLVSLQPIVDTEVSIPSLLIVLFSSLNSQGGLGLVQKVGYLLPDLSAAELIGTSPNTYPFFMRPVSNLPAFLIGNIFSALSTIPIIGPLVAIAKSAVANVSIELDFVGCINGNISRGLMIAYFQIFANKDLGASPDDLQKIQDIILITSSVTTLYTVCPTVEVVTESTC